MTKSYKIVERLLSRKSGILADEENLGYYDNNMAAEDEQAAALIQEMGEALELARTELATVSTFSEMSNEKNWRDMRDTIITRSTQAFYRIDYLQAEGGMNMTKDLEMTPSGDAPSAAAASRGRDGERWLLLEVAEFHEQQANACLAAAESAERDGHDNLARHQYAACGVHESSAAYIRSRLNHAAAAESPSRLEGVNLKSSEVGELVERLGLMCICHPSEPPQECVACDAASTLTSLVAERGRIRAETIEECAKVADLIKPDDWVCAETADGVADEIRCRIRARSALPASPEGDE